VRMPLSRSSEGTEEEGLATVPKTLIYEANRSFGNGRLNFCVGETVL